MHAVVAVDLGGTKLAAAVVDSEGNVLARVKRPADRHNSAAKIAAAAAEALASASLSWAAVRAAGLVVPGIYWPGTGAVWAPNLFGDVTAPLARELSALIPIPLAIDNDRTGSVLGERWLGAARGCDDVVFLSVGTGIGAGIVAAGRPLCGANGAAGAVGWFALSPLRDNAAGRVGGWESEAAGPALARRAGMPRAEDVVAAARLGNAAACRALAETVPWLAMGIANLVSAFDPALVVLGGGLMEGAGDLLLEPIRREVVHYAQPIAARRVRIELSQLGGDAGLLGAARLALDYVG